MNVETWRFLGSITECLASSGIAALLSQHRVQLVDGALLAQSFFSTFQLRPFPWIPLVLIEHNNGLLCPHQVIQWNALSTQCLLEGLHFAVQYPALSVARQHTESASFIWLSVQEDPLASSTTQQLSSTCSSMKGILATDLGLSYVLITVLYTLVLLSASRSS